MTESFTPINNWFVAKLSLNVNKTCYSVFGNRSDGGCLSKVVKLNDISLTKVDSCKYLGVIIDSELTWKMHIDYVYLKLLKFTSIFYKLRYKVSPAILRMLYFAFKKDKGTVLMEVFHGTATECHLPYGITQCYLLPDTSEHTPP